MLLSYLQYNVTNDGLVPIGFDIMAFNKDETNWK